MTRCNSNVRVASWSFERLAIEELLSVPIVAGDGVDAFVDEAFGANVVFTLVFVELPIWF